MENPTWLENQLNWEGHQTVLGHSTWSDLPNSSESMTHKVNLTGPH